MIKTFVIVHVSRKTNMELKLCPSINLIVTGGFSITYDFTWKCFVLNMAKKLLSHKRRQLRCQFPRGSDADINISGSQADARRFTLVEQKRSMEGGVSLKALLLHTPLRW